jgi:localization factor PodJL
MSWSGRNGEEELRDRVIGAARRSGLTVGDFVDALAGRGPAAEAGRANRASRDDRGGDGELDHQLDVLSERLKRLSAVPQNDRRVRRGRESTEGADLSEIAEALEGLDRRVRSLAEQRPAAPAHPRPRTQKRTPTPLEDLDRAVAEIAERQQALERDRERPGRADDIDHHFRVLSEKIDQLRAREDRDPSGSLVAEIRSLRQSIEQRSGIGTDVSEEVRRLTGKLDELVAQRPTREVLEPVMVEIGRLRDAVLQNDVEGSLKNIEAGYGRIVGRLDDLKLDLGSPKVSQRIDREISEIQKLLRSVPQVAQIASIEKQLAALDEKIERIADRSERSGGREIERRIAEFKGEIERIDPTPMIEALDRRLKTVGERLEAIERSARGPVSADRVAELIDEMRVLADGSRANEEIRAVERRLDELAAHLLATEERRPTAEDTDRIIDRIGEIAGKVDRISEPAADRHTVEALEATLSRLDELFSRRSDAPDAALDARFGEILERLDQDRRSTTEVEALTREVAAMRRDLARKPGFADLEAQMRNLAEKLEQSSRPEIDDDALGQIEGHLERITERLTSTESRFDGLATLEENIRRLEQRLETQQVDAIGAARTDGPGEAMLRALQDDLRSLQSAARETESRTNDTLISLHDALTGIVGRLTTIEKIAQGSARQAVHRAQAATAAPPTLPLGSEPIATGPATAGEPAAEPLPPRPTIAGRPVDPAKTSGPRTRLRDLLGGEDTRPLEPGSGKPTPKVAAAPTAKVAAAASTPAPEPTPISSTSEPRPAGGSEAVAHRKADFIAAARRAAQAAASAAAEIAPAAPQDRPAATAPAEEEHSGGSLSAIGRALRNRRRPLVLATAAVVLAILALRFMPGGGEHTAAVETRAPAVAATDDGARPTASLPKTAAADPAPVTAEPTATVVPEATPATTGDTGGAPTLPPARIATTEPTPPPAAAAPAATPPRAPTDLRSPKPDSSLLAAPVVTGSVPTHEVTQPRPNEAAALTTPATPPPAVDPVVLPREIGSEALRRAATAGDPRAAFEVGMRWAEGRGIAADPKSAVEWYRRAAEKSFVPAEYRLAVAFEKGLGTPRDPAAAKRWYQQAAEAGNIRAMHNLGVLYANGRDMASAIPWFQKAADRGLKDSQFNLGIIHALGSGVKQDLAVSYKWFALAARQGDKEAEKKQTEVAGHLDHVTLAAARMAVQTWMQQPTDRTANDETAVWSEPKTVEAAMPVRPIDATTVSRVQNLLRAAGLFNGSADGEMGPKTRTAIRAFQKKTGQPETGEIDERLLTTLSGGRTL